MAQGEPKSMAIYVNGNTINSESWDWDTSAGWSTDKILTRREPIVRYKEEKWSFTDPEVVELRKRLSKLEEKLEEKPLTALSHPADVFMLRLCKAMHLEPNRISRIVMDLQVGQPIKCFVEYYAGDEILKLELPTDLEIYHVGKDEISHTF